jgi:predicted GNAT family acetyltransferase
VLLGMESSSAPAAVRRDNGARTIDASPDRRSRCRPRRARAFPLRGPRRRRARRLAEYRLRPPLIAFTHTLIDPRFEGQGLATRLIRAALSEARSAGLVVLPFCPFVRSYIAGPTAEYLDLAPGDLRDAFELHA